MEHNKDVRRPDNMWVIDWSTSDGEFLNYLIIRRQRRSDPTILIFG